MELLSLIDCRRPRCPISKALAEGREALKITVLRDKRDALLAARRRDQCVIKERRLVVEQLPTFLCSDGRENTAALGEGGAGWDKHASAAFKRLEYSPLAVARRVSRPGARGEFLHHDGAQIGDRERSTPESDNVRLALFAPAPVQQHGTV